jgi:hypothetical protein
LEDEKDRHVLSHRQSSSAAVAQGPAVPERCQPVFEIVTLARQRSAQREFLVGVRSGQERRQLRTSANAELD